MSSAFPYLPRGISQRLLKIRKAFRHGGLELHLSKDIRTYIVQPKLLDNGLGQKIQSGFHKIIDGIVHGKPDRRKRSHIQHNATASILL